MEANVNNLVSGYKMLTPAEQLSFRLVLNLGILLPSYLFKRTEIIVTALAQKYERTITAKEIIPTILKLKKDGGNFDRIGDDITSWDYDGNLTYQTTEEISMVVDKFLEEFLEKLKHAQIQSEQKRLEIYLPVNIVQGALLVNELVESGYINKNGFEVVIYCNETKDNVPVRLHVFRDDDGDVFVDVSKVFPRFVCCW